MGMKLYLASTSSWKSKLLNDTHLYHDTLSSEHDEVSNNTDPYEYVKEIALSKANNVKDQVKSGIIIGLDTVNYASGKIIEKPKTFLEAKENVLRCSNAYNSVITGIAIINLDTNEIVNTYAETIIYFDEITDEEAQYYVDNEPAALRVSGFVVETIMSNFVSKIEGSYYNILGVPVEKIYSIIKEMGYNLGNTKRK